MKHLFKVEIMNKAERSAKTETAFKLLDKNKDGFITRQEFLKVFPFSFLFERKLFLWENGCFGNQK